MLGLAFKCRHGHMLGFFIWQVKGNTRKSGEHIENQHPPGQVLPVFPFVWCPGVFTTCGSWSNKQLARVRCWKMVDTCSFPSSGLATPGSDPGVRNAAGVDLLTKPYPWKSSRPFKKMVDLVL